MPEQPNDPLHYEMKIPPEKKAPKHKPQRPPEPDQEPEAETAKDINVVRGDDEKQSARHSG